MIERLLPTDNPILQRTSINEGLQISHDDDKEKKSSTNHLGEQQLKSYDRNIKEKAKEVVKGLNDFLEPAHTFIKFKLHEKLNEYYVTIVNENTNEVVKEIPAKKLLDSYAAMAERLGFIVDKKV